jgi:hypothetical protein
MYGPNWWDGDQRGLASMLMGFSRALPDIALHGHNNLRGDSWIGDDLRAEAAAKVRRGECSLSHQYQLTAANFCETVFTEEELQHFESLERNSHRNLTNVCLPHHPIFNVSQPSEACELLFPRCI